MRARLLVLPELLASDATLAARQSYPNEACGLIEGIETNEGWRALTLHRCTNLADDPARHFLVDPNMHFALLRSLRGSERSIIGCYHSHPNGRDVPSEQDRAQANDPGFVWLIVGGDPGNGFALSAYVFDPANGFSPLLLKG